MDKDKSDNYRDRVCDKETESFRMWNTTDKEKEKIIKETKDDSFEVDIGEGYKTNLCGFNKATDKKTGELVFAFKIKTDLDTQTPMILYYIAHIKDEELLKSINEIFWNLKRIGIHEVQNMRDKFPTLLEELKIMDANGKLNEKLKSKKGKKNGTR